MVRLFVDSSGEYLSLLIKNGADTVAYFRISCGRRMSELINPGIDFLLKSANISLDKVDEFYVVTGPGSFTGVRIGVACVMGLGAGMGKMCYGLTSLDCVALSSGLPRLKAASRLKGDVFAVREYDFEKGVFGEFYCQTIDVEHLNEFILVNTDNSSFVDLEKTISHNGFLSFRGECSPLYLRKSEAEINLDKKGSC